MGNLTLLEALKGGAFDRLIWQHSGEFDQNFSKKSNAPGFARGGGGRRAVSEVTGALYRVHSFTHQVARLMASLQSL